MTMFGIKESDVANLVREVTGERLESDQTRDRVARAFWSGIAEPGDGMAGMLIAALGASTALDAVIGGRTAQDIATLLRREGHNGEVGPPVVERDIHLALERWRPRLSPQSVLVSLRQAQRYGARLLTPASPLWPSRLADLGHYGPVALWVRGTDVAMRSLEASISLVGSRAATGYGEHVTMEASAGLVDRGYAIVSGAAYGIDAMAHRAALASEGMTVAVLAGGVDRLYPSGNEVLITRIIETGAVISELPCGASPTKWRFLQRNRLIAALSLATVVVEAGSRSGAVNTAGHAVSLGRPLGAVPGPVTSAASAGTHRLIREFDAVCVTNADEMAELAPILVELSPIEAAVESVSPTGRTLLGDRPSLQIRVCDGLSSQLPRSSVDVAARCGLSVRVVRSILESLEREGRVAGDDSGWMLI
ncbi:MAG: dprA [Glaciihabitans sp.]|nr:dprA [Glaciihabitans sp.]